jgi:hypothetical protein
MRSAFKAFAFMALRAPPLLPIAAAFDRLIKCASNQLGNGRAPWRRTFPQRRVVLLDRIELSTSPFIPLRLTPPPYREGRSWSGLSLHHDRRNGFRCHPSSLYTYHLSVGWLGIADSLTCYGFPEFGRFAPSCFHAGRQIYQGSALPLSYSSTSHYKPR